MPDIQFFFSRRREKKDTSRLASNSLYGNIAVTSLRGVFTRMAATARAALLAYARTFAAPRTRFMRFARPAARAAFLTTSCWRARPRPMAALHSRPAHFFAER